MVLGMSSNSSGGRAPPGDTRRQPKRHIERQQPEPQQTVPIQQPKHMPSAEQVHIARMLTDDRTPLDIQERIQQVQSVVDCVEDSIIIALHDNEFDITKACEALLDSNGSNKEEWMTMSTTKKSKKKTNEHHKTSKGSSKAASLSTRQNYGGSVTVTTEVDADKKGSGRPRSGPKGGRGDKRRDRPPGGYRNKKQEGRFGGGGGASFEGRFPPRHRQKESVNEDKQPTEIHTEEQHTKEESWDDNEDTPTSEDWVIVATPTSDNELRNFFTDNTTEEAITSVIEEPSVVKEISITKQRRFKASQIPSKPVEMPSGIDELSYEIDVLGIGFGIGTTPIATPSPTEPRVPSPLTYDQPINTPQQPLPMSNTANTSLLSSSPYTTDISDDPIIISSIKGPPDDLEPPPGLIHPSQQQTSNDIIKPATPTLLPTPPDPISLPPLSQATPTSTLLSTGIPPLSEGSVVNDNASDNEPSYGVMKHQSAAAGNSTSYSSVTSSTTHSLFSTVPAPQSQVIVTPSTQPNNNTSQQSSQRINTSIQAPIQLPQVSGNKSHPTTTTASGVHPMAAAAVYPPILPQFHAPYGTTPVMMPGPPYTYDVDSINRYQGFYGQHPTSQEQGGGASLSSGIGRDPQSAGGGATSAGSSGTLSFTTDNKYDAGSTSTQQPTLQQQQQQQPTAAATHNQINHPFYGQFPYVMYPMGMATPTAPAGYSQMGHKPTGGSSYPTGTSYQAASHQYPYTDDVYTSLKSNQVTSTTSADFNAAFPKHQFDQQKGNTFGAYNMPPPLGMAGGYVMGHHHVPPLPPMGGSGHDSTRGGSKSHKFSNVGSGGGPSVWPQSQHT